MQKMPAKRTGQKSFGDLSKVIGQMMAARKRRRTQILTSNWAKEMRKSRTFLAQRRRKTVAAPNWVKFTQIETRHLFRCELRINFIELNWILHFSPKCSIANFGIRFSTMFIGIFLGKPKQKNFPWLAKEMGGNGGYYGHKQEN